jgi:hypothetical protein
MSKITLEDVLEFIRNEATHRDLDPIADALENEGHSFECETCSDRDIYGCNTCTPEKDVEFAARIELLQQIIGRGNQFGLEDMLDELRREGESVGVYLNQGVVA